MGVKKRFRPTDLSLHWCNVKQGFEPYTCLQEKVALIELKMQS